VNGRLRAAPLAAVAAAAAFIVSLHPVPVTVAPAPPAAVVRLHVVANSDSGPDLAAKLQVRSALLPVVNRAVRRADSAAAARADLRAVLPTLRHDADHVLSGLGLPYAARVVLGPARFPAKTFGPIRLGAGTYTALTVVLGRGRGQNWWCLVFPQLCAANPLAVTEQPERASAAERLGGRSGPARRVEPLWRWLWGALTHLL
jgi:stage II sporulation protein R